MPAQRIPVTAALVLAISALVGCRGGGSTHEGGTAAAGGQGSPSATAFDVNPVPRDQVADGGTLHWPLNQIPPNLNYAEVDGTLLDTTHVVDATLPELFSFDAEAAPSINRNYLEAAELTARDPRQVVTYKVNPKATWSDGTASASKKNSSGSTASTTWEVSRSVPSTSL